MKTPLQKMLRHKSKRCSATKVLDPYKKLDLRESDLTQVKQNNHYNPVSQAKTSIPDVTASQAKTSILDVTASQVKNLSLM